MSGPKASRSLLSARARLKHLEQLVGQLSLRERRALAQMLEDQDDDFFSLLPAELIIQIFSHLPLLDVWRLRTVNKRWNATLSSDLVLRTAILRWETHDSLDSACIRQSSAQESTTAKEWHMKAMMLGRPFAYTTFNVRAKSWPSKMQANRPHALQGSRIAYICLDRDGQSDCVNVHDLIAGTTRRYYGDAKEHIQCIALTSRVIAFANYSGKLYMKDLQDDDRQPKTFRMPSANVQAIHGDETAVAILLGSSDNSYTITIYDYSSRAARAFDFTHSETASEHSDATFAPQSLLLTLRQSVIDVFSGVQEPGPKRKFRFRHTRYSIAGKQTCGSVQEFDTYNEVQSTGTYISFMSIGEVHSVGKKGIFSLDINPYLCNIQTFGGIPRKERALLCFDANRVHFLLMDCLQHLRQDKNVLLSPTGSVKRWKNIEYRAEDSTLYSSFECWPSTAPSLPQSHSSIPRSDEDAHRTFTRPASTSFHLDGNSANAYWGWWSLFDCEISVNESFLVFFPLGAWQTSNRQNRIKVFCFEEGLVPRDEDDTKINRISNDGVWQNSTLWDDTPKSGHLYWRKPNNPPSSSGSSTRVNVDFDEVADL